jgi:hypothetical protein
LLTALVLGVLAVTPVTARTSAAGPREAGERNVASLERRGLGEFDSVDSRAGIGRVRRERGRAYDGRHAARAQTPGGSGNRFARGTFAVRWEAGADVWYGAAFFIPRGFYGALGGQVEVLRWDNWALARRTQDQGGVVVLPDGRWALLRKSAGVEEQALVTRPVASPAAGRWHWVEVRQRLAGDATARNELWIDGERVAASREPNWYGRPVTAVRAGIVAVTAERQRDRLSLWFDRVVVAPRRTGPRTTARASATGPRPGGP